MHERDYPLQLDNFYYIAMYLEIEGSNALAGYIYRYMAHNYGNRIWMFTRAANALYKANRLSEALELITTVNKARPSVSSLLIEARIWRAFDRPRKAVELLTKARTILDA